METKKDRNAFLDFATEGLIACNYKNIYDAFGTLQYDYIN